MKFELRDIIQTDLFDYLELSGALRDFTDIRGKIHRLLANGEIIRIKKGVYTFPEKRRRFPLSLPLVANRLYGPSYVSGDYALAYYGLIPETVRCVTSVTPGRSRSFATPFGNFFYSMRQSKDYSIGFDMAESPGGPFLIATPEKALYDKVLGDMRFDGQNVADYLWNDLRLDPDITHRFSPSILDELAQYARGRMKNLVRYLKEIAE